jgi:hypothetical protein
MGSCADIPDSLKVLYSRLQLERIALLQNVLTSTFNVSMVPNFLFFKILVINNLD